MKIFYSLLLFLFLIDTSVAQESAIDSLNVLIEQSEEDTIKVQLLLDLGKMYLGTDPHKAISISEQALALSESINYLPGVASSFKNIGLGYFYLSDYIQALYFWQSAKFQFEQLNDAVGVSNMLNNMGAIYFEQSDYAKAMDLYLQSLKLAEEVKDSSRIATALQNIGALHQSNKDYKLALDALIKALPVFEALKNQNGIGVASLNIAEIYHETNNYDAALIYTEKSLEFLKSTAYYPAALRILGEIYLKKNDFDKGLKYLNSSYKEALALDNNLFITESLNAIALVYQEKGELELAINFYEKSVPNALEISNSNSQLLAAYNGLLKIHSSLGNTRKALEYQILVQAVKDSIHNIESTKEQNRLLFNYAIEKKEGEIALLEKDNEIQKAKEEKQKLIRNGFIFGFLVLLVFASVFFIQRNKIKKGKKLSDKLLHNILPEEVAEELKEKGESVAKDFEDVTVLFSDFKEFTNISENLSAQELVAEINICFKAFDSIITSYGMEKIKTIGDSYMTAGGLHIPRTSTTKDVVMAGLEMRDFIRKRKNELEDQKKAFFEMRIGIHTGPVVAGIVGEKKFQYDIWGNTVNTASRMESNGEIDKVNISQHTYDLIKDDPFFTFEKRGKIQVKGKGELEMYFVGLKNGAS